MEEGQLTLAQKLLAANLCQRMRTDKVWAGFWMCLATCYLHDNGKAVTRDNISTAIAGMMREYILDDRPFRILIDAYRQGERNFSMKNSGTGVFFN